MSEATYTRCPVKVRALQWTGDNFAEVEKFVGAARCAAHNPKSGLLYVYAAEGIKTVFVNYWLYFDEFRELHVMSYGRFLNEFELSRQPT
jgi:hypothetical protein